MDMGQQIADCVNQLTAAHGGICDARAFSGPQQNLSSPTGSDLVIGAAGKPVELMLGPVVLTTNQVIKVQRSSSILGMPSAVDTTTSVFGSMIMQAPGSNLGAVVELDGGTNVLQDLTINGNKANNPVSGSDIFVNRASHVQLFRVSALNSNHNGILVYSDRPGTDTNGNPTGNQSCCSKFLEISASGNAHAGLFLSNTADIYIATSSFENNSGNGIELSDSPTLRIENSDLGGNLADGIHMYGSADGISSNKQIIVGNQFGNNGQHDIEISGPYSAQNLISSNEFIGSKRRQSGYDGIHIENSGLNNIVGNTFFASSHPFAACIHISNSQQMDQLVGNLCAEKISRPYVIVRNGR